LISNYTGPDIERDAMATLAIRAGEQTGKPGYHLPYEKWDARLLANTKAVLFHTLPHAMGFDVTSADGLSDCVVEMRRQAVELFSVLKNGTDEFRECEFGPFAALPGVRESRRIVGRKTVTGDDARSGRKFDDGLFTVAQDMDFHKCTEGEPSIRIEKVQPYQIPYGSLLPEGLENILVVGRGISGDHEALASYRLVASCFAMGEAAAIASKMAIENKTDIGGINIPALVSEMSARGYQNNQSSG
jgi:hypothetical protein